MRVGDYVRTEIGEITKIEKVTLPEEPSDCLFVKFENEPYSFKYKLWQTIDFKSSPKIINLVQVGDYVNGFKIDDITEKDEDHPERIVWHLTYYGDDDIPFRNDDIKSIVTKEMFTNAEYRVETD